jgi:hypothetical protein
MTRQDAILSHADTGWESIFIVFVASVYAPSPVFALALALSNVSRSPPFPSFDFAMPRPLGVEV